MKNSLLILFSLLIVISTLYYYPNEKVIGVFAKENSRKVDTFEMDLSVSDASKATFLGEDDHVRSGWSVSGVGDVNGDGYDDILIGAVGHQLCGSLEKGYTYLILGKRSGWSMDTDLSNADASFIGEDENSASGWSVSGAGDVNGDGYDDILIGAVKDDDGGLEAGQTYLILGKPTGWSMDTGLTNADASFWGEDTEDHSGFSVSGAGDVNGDGYHDILIGAFGDDDGGEGAGQTYLILGKPTGWSMDTDLSKADASFWGEDTVDSSGFSVSGAGDVNGDGYDDILIGAVGNMDGGPLAGQSYLILGKPSGWSMDTDLSNADASFWGEDYYDSSGSSVSGAGDVNGDGYDDILIGAAGDDDGGEEAGQTYLIMGKSSGWSMDTDLSNADASYWGEDAQDSSGMSVSGTGDVNGDDYDDFLIGAYGNDDGGSDAGQTYLILGKPFGWSMDTDLSNVDASFWGENVEYSYSFSVSGAGDVNGDGYDDILIGAYGNDDGGSDAGQTYLIAGIGKMEPLEIFSVKTYSDGSYTQEADRGEINDEIFIELRGLDGNTTSKDRASVIVSYHINTHFIFPILLEETGINTGIYRNSIKFSTKTDPDNNLLGVSIGDIVNISSYEDPSMFALIEVTARVVLKPFEDVTTAVEDNEYRVHYENTGLNKITEWTFDSDSTWLGFNAESQDLFGTPNNGDVGYCWVKINITDGQGHYDEHYFTIEILNSPPNITTEDQTEAVEGELYSVDYNCDDDGQGTITWSMTTSMEWLEIDSYTGILSGTPLQWDVGTKSINIEVDDGHGGVNSTVFDITVIAVNKPPIIQTDDITTGKQGEKYYRNYEAHDPDDNNILHWVLTTNASFLTLTSDSGILEGIPGNGDIGVFYVNVTVMDQDGLIDSNIFNLSIENVNDKPVWVDIPVDIDLFHGQRYYFDVNATDPDQGTLLEYTIRSTPESDITIDIDSGEITWIASVIWFEGDDNKMEVTIKVSDGEVFANMKFTISVLPTGPPTVELLLPENGVKTPSNSTKLSWDGTDPEGEPITYDVFLHESQSYVIGKEISALYIKSYNGTSIVVPDLDLGKTYFWTVIPHDGCSYGICSSGVRSFRVNNLPNVQKISVQSIFSGDQFEYKLKGSDGDQEDKYSLEYRLINAPEGMKIDIDTGMITWKPSNDQIGDHHIVFSVSDDMESITDSFDIVVKEKEEENNIGIILSVLGIFILFFTILVLIIIFMFLRKRQEVEEAEDEVSEIKAELDKKYAEKEPVKNYSDVPLTPREALADQKQSDHEITYEELYGPDSSSDPEEH